jgi:hypothetical protein
MYSNNSEYRRVLRKYFNMNVEALEKENSYLKDQDSESYDELLYDDEAMSKGMDIIKSKTIDNPIFVELYKKAAGQFLSEDIDTGLCVLLTYSYFSQFINLYEDPTNDILYKSLLKNI